MSKSADRAAEVEQDADLSTVAGRIKYARRRIRLSQQELADALPAERRKTRAAIGQYEAGNNLPPLDVIYDMAEVLGQDPRFLAFGGEPDPTTEASPGRQVEVRRANVNSLAKEYAVLPPSFLEDFGAKATALSLVQLAVDAPAFGVRARDYLVLDIGCSAIEADGRLYAVQTSAGVALVRAEPSLSRSDSATIQLTGGQGTAYSVAPDELEIEGRLIGTMQRQG